jgi:hypothetical protein
MKLKSCIKIMIVHNLNKKKLCLSVNSNNYKISVNFDKCNRRFYEVKCLCEPQKEAAYNLQGLIAYELKDNATASRAFGEALKIMPEFTTATQNANAITVELQNQNAKDAKTPKK